VYEKIHQFSLNYKKLLAISLILGYNKTSFFKNLCFFELFI